MKRFSSRIILCLLPCLVAAAIVGRAVQLSNEGKPGFKLGVDLVGGTILVYEVDESKELPPNYDPAELAASLKRRIDPADLRNVTIRAVGKNRVEIILPTGAAEAGKSAYTSEEIQEVKSLISQVGSLEFRILANGTDDREAFTDVEQMYATPNKDEERRRAERGDTPSAPAKSYTLGAPVDATVSYSFVQLEKEERKAFGLSNDFEAGASPGSNWKKAEQGRKDGKPFQLTQGRSGGQANNFMFFSRDCVDAKLPKAAREERKYEYFILVRNPEESKAITGKYLTNSYAMTDEKLKPAVGFSFNNEGAYLFNQITTRNRPSGESGNEFFRHLAIILDGMVVSAPSINSPINGTGTISGNFKKVEVERLVSILKAGALPATLKQQPVSENSMGATLGEDTIKKGTISVGIAFAAVMVFMVIYYRFAGVVACIALFANLLLTLGFMIAVHATFTLPGLAGLVLMLGMAVDANVLIYERLREERDRGASLPLAIRNGYDRAFPTIIDTHLSSIFTAIVLYMVGNDQLKGFGISLTVGLIISLFTSLVMTRLLFDIWTAKGWLHKLSMARFLTRTNIDFMGIRYYWFTATILLTVFGLTVFLARGEASLNIDFTGGTAYGGRLKDGIQIGELRPLVAGQADRLKVTEAKKLDADGKSYRLTYGDGGQQTVRLTKAEPDEAVVARTASILPDASIEQIFVASDPSAPGTSKYFTIRTSEKEPDLVQVSIDRLLGDRLAKIDMGEPKVLDADAKADTARSARLMFDDFASPGQVKLLLERAFQDHGLNAIFQLRGSQGAEEREGRFKSMDLDLQQPAPLAKFKAALGETREAFSARPLPERLENFDSQLAKETQMRALYAILASWIAIALYLWFRFGSWTFGLAAVACLAHDLFLSLGLIAFCHWLHQVPGLAPLLQIEDFKIDLPAIAALLTLVGYSVNDTIVVFDRIREVRGKSPDLTPQMINDSVNQTLSRTLLTALTVFLVVAVLYFFGGEGIHLFAFVMVIGVVIGTYSSIYIASPLLLLLGEGAPAHNRSVAQRRSETARV